MKYEFKKRNKFGNDIKIVDGIKFASKKEANRYCELRILERAGQISDLQLQVEFILIPAQYREVDGKRKCVERECKYFADFVYKENGKRIVEDAKGFKTDVYKIKRKLMLYKYGIRIREV